MAVDHGSERTHDEDGNRQIVSRAVSSDALTDIFATPGLKKSDTSLLSDDFLGEVRRIPQRNLPVEMPRKLLEGEIKQRSKKNVVQARYADTNALQALLVSLPSERLTLYPVSPLVNSPKNDGPEVIERVAEAPKEKSFFD